MNLEVSAKWKGSDRIIVEGSVALPKTATLQAWICQDGQMTVALRPKDEPEIKDGKIKAEWELIEDAGVGPIFDPDARFETTLAAQSEIGLPFFIVRIPVEGRPE